MNQHDKPYMQNSKTVNVTGNKNISTRFFAPLKLEGILDAVPGPVIYCDPDLTLYYGNKALRNIAGKEVYRVPLEEVFAPKSVSFIRSYLDKAEPLQQLDWPCILAGQYYYFRTTITSDIDDSGKLQGYIISMEDRTADRPNAGLHTNSETDLASRVSQLTGVGHLDATLYRQLLENVPAAIYTCDKEGIITFYNKAAAELWGREPVIGKDLWCGSWKIYQPDRVTPVELDSCPMAIALKEGRPVTGVEIVVERMDGQKRDVLPSPVPLFDRQGNIAGAVNMLLDITERKQAEKKLGHLAAIVRSSSDPIISKTLEGIVTSWNEAAQKVFGYREEEMIGQHISRIIPKDRLDEEPRILEKLKKGETVDHFETKRITSDGKVIDISLSISPVKGSRGNIIGASKIARDITVQKKLHEDLQKSEERLRMASESTQLGTWEFDPLSKQIYWSDECRKIFGITEKEELTSAEVSLQTFHEDRGRIDELLSKVSDPNISDYFIAEYRIVRKNDGALRWIKVRAKMYFDEDRTPHRFIGTMVDITEDRQRDQMIRENEERLRMAIQSTRLGTWEYQPGPGLLKWSDLCREIYGISKDAEVEIKFFREHIHPEDQQRVLIAMEEAFDPTGSGEFDNQFRIIRNDEQVRWVRSQGKASFTSTGEVDKFIGTLLDITEEKRQEEELLNSVELFTTMADNVPAMIWMSGDDKFRDFFNKTWLEFTGRTIEQESNEGWLENVHPEDIQRCIDNYNLSFSSQKGFYTEYRLRRHDGTYRWVADSSVPRYNRDGSFAGFISACMDIDDQKNYREKILASELRLQTISNAAPVGLWMTDAEAQNTFVNETWIRWTGQPLQEQLGAGWLTSVVEEYKAEVPAKFRDSMLKRQKFSTEFRITRGDGEIRWCLTEGSPHYNINGEFAGYAGSVTDITEIKQMEARKDDFIKMASHELKTPITSIKGYVQLLLNIYNEANEEKFQASRNTVRSSLQTVSKQVNKLTRLVSELLDLSRIESGKLELYKMEFDLGNLVEESVQDLRLTATHHAILLHNEFKGKVYGDKDRLSQVLLNLITNAIKYSPESDVVEVFLSKVDGQAQIKVKDSGIGIDSKDHQKIFERFYRVEGKSELTFPGFGIGLFIASEIIARHNGSIHVESERNRGSVFTVTLPIVQEPNS